VASCFRSEAAMISVGKCGSSATHYTSQVALGGPPRLSKGQSIVTKRVATGCPLFTTLHTLKTGGLHTRCPLFTTLCSDSDTLPTPSRSKAKARRDGRRAFLSLTYYLNYTRLTRTVYQLSVGAKLLMVGLLRENWRNRGLPFGLLSAYGSVGEGPAAEGARRTS
jgi:hypothetical protein